MKRRIRWRWVYLALLVASLAWQWLIPTSVPGDIQRTAVTAPASNRTATLAHTDTGPRDAPVLLLLHGSPGSLHNFDHLTPLLNEHLRVIAVDLVGYGHSTRWTDDYSISAQADHVLGLMDAMGIDAAHVLGFSLGSGVAIEMAAEAPQRIRSLIFYGGIGVQEGEGSGDYHFEHFKYRVGYIALVLAPELLPHFGLLGTFADRHGFLRSFMDTDQRPLRDHLQTLTQPLLILHGKNDPLVPAWTAREHHRLVPHSELVMFDASHFMVFSDEGSTQLAAEILPFVERHADSDVPPQPRTVDPFAAEADAAVGPIDLQLDRELGPWLTMGLLVIGTFISEDLTCITAGLQIRAGNLDLFVGVLGCFLGIFIGDVLLWLAGRLIGRPLLKVRWIAARVPTARLDRLANWYETHGWWAVFASRFMPGTRLPLYTAAGMLGTRARKFILWAAISDFIYTPLLVVAIALFGHIVAEPVRYLLGDGWLALVGSIVVIFFLVRTCIFMLSAIGRARLLAGVQRVYRWEFWPGWLFNIPVFCWYVVLAIRHRGLTVMTATNPGIPDSGWVGESKIDILSKLPPEVVATARLIPPGDAAARLDAFGAAMADAALDYPVILKPDAGQRGASVRLCRDEADARTWFEEHTAPAVVQQYHPGPEECGIFYIRHPDVDRGFIFSITDKQFPILEGDGRHTLEQLIYRHPRYRMQADRFIKRHVDQLQRVLDKGERFRLAMAGNHAQGTLFRDGEHLRSPQLEDAIDRIAQTFEGFHFGRFDLRYTDAASLKRGEGFKVIELNGVTSESTNIYDPSWSLWRAYRTLFRQWSLAFQIGAANMRRGHPPTSAWTLVRRMRQFYRGRDKDLLAD